MFALLSVFITQALALSVVGDVKVPDINVNPVIVGGNRAVITEAPFMAQYVTEFEPINQQADVVYCGASILTDRFVLSAAHCYDEEKRKQHYVTVGTDISGLGQHLRIEKTIAHPKYDDRNMDNDLLVIKLRRKLQFSATVQPIKMADSNLVINDGAYLDVFGFGKTQFGTTSKYLLRVSIPYISHDKCKAVYSALTDRMICAGENGKDSCEGDSGGPLVYGNILVGVVSFGSQHCGNPIYPGVYASVSKLRRFIDVVIRNNSFSH